MSFELDFVETEPRTVVRQLDGDSIHLWRIPYAARQGRAPLLALLGTYLGKPASEVRLAADRRGKPRLAHIDCGSGFDFNWSHSGEYALVALSRGSRLGVDIECLDRKMRTLEVARRFFDPAESETLASLADPARDRAFIGLWCAKEAVLKAAGEGLSFGLARLVFAWEEGGEWKLARVDPALGGMEGWQLVGFDAAPNYRGALAWRGPASRIAAFQPRRPAPERSPLFRNLGATRRS